VGLPDAFAGSRAAGRRQPRKSRHNYFAARRDCLTVACGRKGQTVTVTNSEAGGEETAGVWSRSCDHECVRQRCVEVALRASSAELHTTGLDGYNVMRYTVGRRLVLLGYEPKGRYTLGKSLGGQNI